MITVRYATLADTAAISAIHCSDIVEWYRSYIDETGLRQKEVATWEECSLMDRYAMGGPWMSPEMCAVYLNSLLLNDQIPLVAEVDGQVVGELELYVAKDDLYGINANLSVFYVHRDWRSRGIGTVLLQDAIELVKEIGCETLTTYNPEIPHYYNRLGLVPDRELQLVVVPCEAARKPYSIRTMPLPSYEALQPLKLLSGRILSAYQLYYQLQEEAEPGAYVIPAAWRPSAYSFTLYTPQGKAYCALRDRSGNGSWATVHLWGAALERETIATLLAHGSRLGFAALHFIVPQELVSAFAEFPHHPVVTSTVIHCLKIDKE